MYISIYLCSIYLLIACKNDNGDHQPTQLDTCKLISSGDSAAGEKFYRFYEYDSLDRLKRFRESEGLYVKIAYNSNNQVIKSIRNMYTGTDEVKNYEYDAQGRWIKVIILQNSLIRTVALIVAPISILVQYYININASN